MPQITVYVLNSTQENHNAHVYDQFANGRREVDGSPFALAAGQQSVGFAINADNDGAGEIAYKFDGGPMQIDKDVRDGTVFPMD